jgi:hypothetical protein
MPGSGTLSLLGAAAQRAADAGMAVLAAQASELERGHAFEVVLQLFEFRLMRADPTGGRNCCREQQAWGGRCSRTEYWGLQPRKSRSFERSTGSIG